MTEYVKTIVVESPENSEKSIENLLLRYCPFLQVIEVVTNLEEASNRINKERPKLIFIDVVWKEHLVFDFLSSLTEHDFQIVFMAEDKTHAFEALNFDTLGYLLRPFNVKVVGQTMQKVHQYYKKHELFVYDLHDYFRKMIAYGYYFKKSIAISSQNEIALVKEMDIISCSSLGRYTIICLKNGEEIVSCKNLGEYEKLLGSQTFFRIHNSHIINLNFLIKIDKKKDSYCLMSNGSLMPLAKRRKDELKKRLRF